MKISTLAFPVILLCLLAQASHLHLTGFEQRTNDEYLYFKSTNEMLASGNFLSPTFFGENRFEKPILFYWFILLSYKLGGTSWLAARSVSVFFAMLTAILTWLIGRQLFNARIAFLSGIVLITMPLFFAHTRTAVPDMALNFFVVLGFYALIRFVRSNERKFALLLFASCAVGFMVKGFPALIPLIALVIYAVWARNASMLRKAGWPEGILLMAVIIAPWFLYMINLHGRMFLDHIMTQELEQRTISVGQGQLLWRALGFIAHNFVYYLGILWNNLAPWSLFLLAGFPYLLWRQNKADDEGAALRLLLSCFFGVFFLFVFIAMQQYNVQYMLLASTPAAILSAFVLLLPLEGSGRLAATLRFMRKFICLFVFSVGFLLFGYFQTFFAPSHQVIVGLAVVAVYAAAIVSALWIKDHIWAPLLLGLMIIFVTAQMSFFARNRLSVISSLEVASRVIKDDMKDKEATIGITDSVDPKKFWVFFEQRIERGPLRKLFLDSGAAYVVVTEHQIENDKEDGEIFESVRSGSKAFLPPGNYEILWKDLIMAKKMSLDADFFKALLRFDRATVENYILEDIYIIKKTEWEINHI